VVIELWAVEAFVYPLLLLLVLRKQLLCAFLSLIFLCGMMPFPVVIGFGAHSSSYAMGIGGSFPGIKTAEA
jgi:hypothetical protein